MALSSAQFTVDVPAAALRLELTFNRKILLEQGDGSCNGCGFGDWFRLPSGCACVVLGGRSKWGLGAREPHGEVKRPHKPELCLCVSVLYVDCA